MQDVIENSVPVITPVNLERLVAELRAARRASRQAGTQPVRTRDLPSPSIVESVVQRLHATLFPAIGVHTTTWRRESTISSGTI